MYFFDIWVILLELFLSVHLTSLQKHKLRTKVKHMECSMVAESEE